MRNEKNNMVLDITKIEYFLILLEFIKDECLIFFLFLFLFLFRTKLLLILSSVVCHRCVHQVAKWPFLLLLHLFLLFFLPHYSCKVTINASQLFLTFVHKNDLNSSHRNWIEIWFFKDRESDICGNFVNPKIKIGSHGSSRTNDKNCAV